MVHLAPELIGIILRNVKDNHTLVSSRLVSKSFEAIGAPVVWRKLRIVKPGPSSNPKIPFEVISKAAHISPYVKEIEFDTTNLKFPDELLENIPGMLDEFSYFPNFKRLESLCLLFPCTSMEPLEVIEEGDEPFDFDRFSYDDDSNEQLSPQRKVRTESFKMLGRIHLEHGFTVPALTIRELYPVPHTGMHAEGLLSFMKSLRELSIAIPEVDPEPMDVADPEPAVFYEAFRKDLTRLLGAATELNTFDYEGDEFADGLDASQWDSLTFPHLESLRLHRVAIRSDSPRHIPGTHPMIDFILRHRETLKHLYLGACNIDAQSRTLFTWGEVFAAFKKELTNMRRFTFFPEPGPEDEGDQNHFSGYVWFDTVLNYRDRYVPVGYEAAAVMRSDRESLRALQREMEERRRSDDDSDL